MTMQADGQRTGRAGNGSLWVTLGFAAVAAALTVVQRLTPHPYNLTMIGALGLWAGARMRPAWLGLALPLVVWGATDLLHWVRTKESAFDALVYVSFLVYAVLGLWLRRTSSPGRIAATCLAGSLQFFLLTNFSAWLQLSAPAEQVPEGQAYVLRRVGEYDVPTYARNVSGLLAAYWRAIPFWRSDAPPLGFLGNVILGDLVFCGLLFSAHALLLRGVSRRQVALQPR